MPTTDAEKFGAIFYTKPQQDFATRDALLRMGIEEVFVPVKLEPGKSRGKNRMPEMHERVLIPRCVFARMTAEDYHEAMVTGAARSILARLTLSQRVWERQARPFIDAAEFDREVVLAKIRAGEQIQHFRTGEELLVKAGPLAGKIATFKASFDDSALGWRVRAETELMGREVSVDFDPQDVERKRA